MSLITALVVLDEDVQSSASPSAQPIRRLSALDNLKRKAEYDHPASQKQRRLLPPSVDEELAMSRNSERMRMRGEVFEAIANGDMDKALAPKRRYDRTLGKGEQHWRSGHAAMDTGATNAAFHFGRLASLPGLSNQRSRNSSIRQKPFGCRRKQMRRWHFPTIVREAGATSAITNGPLTVISMFSQENPNECAHLSLPE